MERQRRDNLSLREQLDQGQADAGVAVEDESDTMDVMRREQKGREQAMNEDPNKVTNECLSLTTMNYFCINHGD